MADSTVSNFAPEFGSLVNPLVQGALGAYGRPAVDQAATADRPFIAGAIPGLTPQQKGALNWTNTLTTRPIDTTAQRNMVYQGTRPTTRVATGAFDTRAGLRAANPYDELVRQRAMTDFDEQASQASARRAAQQIGTRGLGTKTGLANAQFGRDMERQRGDLNSQLLQRGFETGRQQYNADQTRALQAAMGNQNASGRDRALSLQGSNQLQALENFERSAMAQNAGALQGMGSMVAGREQAVADYPWNQVNRLRSVLSGTGQQQSQGSAPWWQTAAGLAGTGASILGQTGAFGSGGWLGNLFSSGAGSGLAAGGGSMLNGIASGAGFADGGYVDDGDDDSRGAFAFDYDDDDPDPDGEVIDAEFAEVAPGEDYAGGQDKEPDGGGEDGVVYEEGGGDEPQLEGAEAMPALGALAPPAAPASPQQGALQAPGLAGKLPTSGYTQAQLQAALAAAAPRAQANPGSTSADAIASLLLGIGGANTRDFGRALAAGGQNMQATLAARKRQDQINEQARQRAALAEAKTISDQMGKDRDIQGKGMIAEAGNIASMDREIRRLEAQEKQGTLNRAGRIELAKLQDAAAMERTRLKAAVTQAGIERWSPDPANPRVLVSNHGNRKANPGTGEGFSGNAVEAQAMNIVTDYQSKKSKGEKTTPEEDYRFALAKRHLEMPTVVGNPNVGFTEVQRPEVPAFPQRTAAPTPTATPGAPAAPPPSPAAAAAEAAGFVRGGDGQYYVPGAGGTAPAPSTAQAAPAAPPAAVMPAAPAAQATAPKPTQTAAPGGAGVRQIAAGENKPTDGEKNEYAKKTTLFANIESSLDRYENMLRKEGASPLGAIGFTTPANARMQTAYTDLMIEMKNLFELGALNGPDFAIMQATLQNPATVRGVQLGAEGLGGQLGLIREKLTSARRNLEKSYPGASNAARAQNATSDPLGIR